MRLLAIMVWTTLAAPAAAQEVILPDQLAIGIANEFRTFTPTSRLRVAAVCELVELDDDRVYNSNIGSVDAGRTLVWLPSYGYSGGRHLRGPGVRATAHERATLDQATIGLSYADDKTTTVEAGGLHTAGGLQLRFRDDFSTTTSSAILAMRTVRFG